MGVQALKGVDAIAAVPVEGNGKVIRLGDGAKVYEGFEDPPRSLARFNGKPAIIVLNAELPARTVPELVAMAKAAPGKLNFAAGGSGGRLNAEIERLLRAFPGLVVVDEAYAPFAAENAVSLLDRHENLVVVRTFSKAYALAGIRVGYALARAGVIDLLDRVRDSYNVSRLSQAAALAAIGDEVTALCRRFPVYAPHR